MGEEHSRRYRSSESVLRIPCSPPSSVLLLEPTNGPLQRVLYIKVSNLVHFPILLWMMPGDLLFARMYACNTKALKMDLESERTIRDSDCGLSSALFRCGIRGGRWWSRLPSGHASRSRAWAGCRPLDSSFGSLCLCVLSWQEGVGSRRAAELEILICNWQGQPAVPTGSPSLNAKPQKTLAAGLCYLITFWRLIQ